MNQSRLWTIGAVMLIVALLAGTWFLGVAPRLSDARDADSALAQAVTLNNTHRQTLAALQADHDRRDEIVAELEEAHSVIPEGLEVPSLLSTVDEMARSSGVVLVNLAFQNPALYVVPDDAPADFIAAGNELVGKGLYVVPVTIEVTGTNASLLNFVSALQGGQRYFHVHQGAVLSRDGAGGLTIQAELFGISEEVVKRDEPSSTPTPDE